jgi:hypothetical protein
MDFTSDPLFQVFLAEVERTIRLYESIIRCGALGTREKIKTHGVIEALSQLMMSPDLQKGFRVLRDHGQLRRTFEALVVRFQQFFRAQVVGCAQWRLDNADRLL